MTNAASHLGRSWQQDNVVVKGQSDPEKKKLIDQFIESSGNLEGYSVPNFAVAAAIATLEEHEEYFQQLYRRLLVVNPVRVADYEDARRNQLKRTELPPWHAVDECLRRIRDQKFLREVVESLPEDDESYFEQVALSNIDDESYLEGIASAHRDKGMRSTATDVLHLRHQIRDGQRIIEGMQTERALRAFLAHSYGSAEGRLAARDRIAELRGLRPMSHDYHNWLTTGSDEFLPERRGSAA